MPAGPGRPLAPVLEGHAIAQLDPSLALMLNDALTGHVVESTRKTYASAAKRWGQFCAERGVAPYPADPIWVCAWIIDVTSSIQVSSLKMYLAGVQYTQVLNGHPWTLRGDELVRRTIRYVTRLHGSPQKGAKLPVTYAVLRSILPLLRGWPTPSCMSHDDLVFALASLIGVSGFLRGGEFLTSPKSVRPVLTGADVVLERIHGVLEVVVFVPRPKNQWWEPSVRVPCFSADPGGVFDARVLLRAYRQRSRVSLRNSDPAFRRSNGATLCRDFMVSKTSQLAERAGIAVMGPDGRAAPVKASSWRAGAVRSAIEGEVSDAMIMAMGRWRSIAWERYLMHSVASLQGASRAMWRAGRGGSSRVVSGFRSSEFVSSVPEEQEVEEEVSRLLVNRRAMG